MNHTNSASDFFLSSQRGNYDVKHFLLYYYYGGMIYTATKNYDRAQYFFRVCITTPALAVSHIMLEAFKKYILISLILEGKVVFLYCICGMALCSRLQLGYMPF